MPKLFRVVIDSGSHYEVMDLEGRILSARLAGRFHQFPGHSRVLRHDLQDRPVVGDWVEGRLEDGEWVFIESRVERKNAIERRLGKAEVQTLAVNVDLILILTAMNEDFNLNRMDRYLTLATQTKIPALLGLSKSDLSPDSRKALDDVKERFPNESAVAFSVNTGLGLEELKSAIAGVQASDGTMVVLGSSGVGKSTLTNWLLGEEIMAISHVREFDGRGRHTTTHRSLHRLPGGGWLMDTPGLRGINPEFSGDTVAAHFADLEDLILGCRFSNCAHQTEPGCAVQAGIETGAVDEARWESFWKLKSAELHQQKMADPLEHRRERERWKKLHHNAREHSKFKRRQGF